MYRKRIRKIVYLAIRAKRTLLMRFMLSNSMNRRDRSISLIVQEIAKKHYQEQKRQARMSAEQRFKRELKRLVNVSELSWVA